MAEQAPATAIPQGPHSSRVEPIQRLIQQWTPLLHPTKSPEEKFQEKYQLAIARYHEASALTSEEFNTARLDAVQSCITQIKALKAEREANKEYEESKYQELYWEQQEALILGLLDTVGPELGDKVCTKWRQRTRLPVNSSAQSNALAGSSSEVTTNTSYCTPNASPVMQSFRLPNPRPQNESAPILPTAEPPMNQETYTISRPSNTSQQSAKAQQKRPANPSQGSLPRPPKRPRSNAPQPRGPLTGDRAIDFDDVYQDGNSATKYIITEHKGFWYILECKKHKLHFMSNNPIHGARRHLAAGTHGNLNVKYDETVRQLGTRVLNCDEGKAKLNNLAAQRPTYAQYGRPLSSVSAGSAHSNEGPQTRSTQFLPGIDPQPGEVYTTFWKKTKRFFAILVLPWGSFRQFGWDMNLMDNTALLKKNIPACYDYDPATGTVDWTENYRPGGKYHHKRKYPIMYFDAPVFPWECAIGWVAVNEFRAYDPNDEGLAHKDKVDEFILRMKDRDRLRNGEEDSGEAAEHQDEDAAAGDVLDEQQSTEVEQPPLGSCMRLAIEIPDDDSDAEEGSGMMPQYDEWAEGETRVKTEPTNQGAPDAAAAETTTNSAGSEMINQWNGLDHTPTAPNVLPALDANGVLHPPAPNTPTADNPSIPSSSTHLRLTGQLYDHSQPPWISEPPARQHPVVDSGPRAPEAVMAPSDPPTANGQAPLASMIGHAGFENSAPLNLYGSLAPGYTASAATANVAGDSEAPWMITARAAVEGARDREIDIRNNAARRSNWRHPFITDDTDE